MIKTIYLCTKHPPFDGRVHYKIGYTLVKQGYEVISIHPNVSSSTDGGIKIKGYLQKSGLFGRAFSYYGLYKRAIKESPCVVFAPEPDSLIVAYVMHLFHRDIKVVFDCHEWYNLHFTHTKKRNKSKKGSILNVLVSNILKSLTYRIDGVITVNDTMTDYYKRYNKKTITIPSLMVNNINPIIDTKVNDFIFFGQFGSNGQEKILLDAARILKNRNTCARILIIGGYHNNEGDDYKEFNQILDSELLRSYIDITGWLTKDRAFDYLSSGIAGIMRFDTTYFNGFPALPNKIFEYMAFGMAIICSSSNVEITKIVEVENCGIVAKNDSGEELANAIIYLVDNHEKCLEFGRNSINSTKNKYNWDNYGKLLNNFIIDL